MSASAAAIRRPNRVLADALPGARVRDAALVLAGALLMALLSQVEIPVPPSPVPITGQTLAVVIAGAALGATRGGLAMLVWALAGLVLPVYAGGADGIGVLTGATGGYIVGFVLAGYAVGWLAERGGDRRLLVAFASFVVGQLIVFGVGVPWLKASTGSDWATAVHDGFSIFVVGGLVKAAVGAAVLPSAWQLVERAERG